MKTTVFTSAAMRQFDALPTAARTKVGAALNICANEARADVTTLRDRPGYRLRVGEYRVLFHEDMSTVLAIYVGRRGTATYS